MTYHYESFNTENMICSCGRGPVKWIGRANEYDFENAKVKYLCDLCFEEELKEEK